MLSTNHFGPRLSLGSLIIRFCKQTIVAGAFLFEQLLNFLTCFIKLVLVFPSRQANNCSRKVFSCFHGSSGFAVVTQSSLSSNMTWRLFFTSGSRRLCTCSFFVWGPFFFGENLKVNVTLQRTRLESVQQSALGLTQVCSISLVSCCRVKT